MVLNKFFFSSVGLGLWFPELANRISDPHHQSSVTVCQIIQSKSQEQSLNASRLFQNSEPCQTVVNDEMYIANIGLGICYFIGFISYGYITQIVHKNTLTSRFILKKPSRY